MYILLCIRISLNSLVPRLEEESEAVCGRTVGHYHDGIMAGEEEVPKLDIIEEVSKPHDSPLPANIVSVSI